MSIHHQRKFRETVKVTYEGEEAAKVAALVSQQLLALPALPDLPALPGLEEPKQVPQLAPPQTKLLLPHRNGVHQR